MDPIEVEDFSSKAGIPSKSRNFYHKTQFIQSRYEL